MDSKVNVLLSQVFIKLCGKAAWINDELYNHILYTLRTGKFANIKNPRTFNEHILARKIFADERELAYYTDKFAVRKYVADTIGEKYLVENYGVWESVDKMDTDSLPDQFILKATHGSGWNVLVKNKNQVDWEKVKNKLSAALKSNYYYKSRERNYKDIQPRIVCEKLLTPADARGVVDFKVFCFHGTGHFFYLAYEQDGRQYYNFYLINGQKLQLKSRYAPITDKNLPGRIDEILPLAEKLAAPFEFVRVDFYLCDREIKFSELTFHSGGGIQPIEPADVDLMLGKFFEK